jgi:transmembrane sensor
MNVSAGEEQLRDLIAEQAAEFYVAHRANDLTREQEQEFLRWLRISPLHVAEYLSIAGIAKDLGRIAALIDAASAQPGDEENIVAINPSAFASEPSTWRGSERDVLRQRIVRAAVACLVVAAVATAAVFTFRDPEKSVRYTTARGEQRTWQLADDTIVHLNSDSSLLVDFTARRRNVSIERGQVYFEVAKDASRPFLVRAGNYTFRDIGTAFDVFRKETGTVISVVEGKVAIWKDEKNGLLPGLATQKHIEDLTAGDQATITQTKIVEREDPKLVQKKATAWLRQEIVFDGETIAAAASEFNRYNRIQIAVDDARVAQMPISGVFHMYGVKSFARFLDALPGVKTETEGNILHVAAGADTHP